VKVTLDVYLTAQFGGRNDVLAIADALNLYLHRCIAAIGPLIAAACYIRTRSSSNNVLDADIGGSLIRTIFKARVTARVAEDCLATVAALLEALQGRESTGEKRHKHTSSYYSFEHDYYPNFLFRSVQIINGNLVMRLGIGKKPIAIRRDANEHDGQICN